MKLLKSILLGFLGISTPMIAGGVIAGVVQQQIARTDAQRFTGFKFLYDKDDKKIIAPDLTGLTNVKSYTIVGPEDWTSSGSLMFTKPGYYRISVELTDGARSDIGGAYITEGCWK